MNTYLSWLNRETRGFWWNDSAVPDQLDDALDWGATGVTLNPVLLAQALQTCNGFYGPMRKNLPDALTREQRTEEIMRRLTCSVAERLLPLFYCSSGEQGYVCAQVDPRRASDRAFMLGAAKRLANWAPNIAVKLPATLAGLDVLEECASLGIPVVGTVSFTLSQALAIAERYEAGRKRSAQPAPGFAVVMVGRIDDYLRDVARDNHLDIAEADIIQCGTAIVKRAYEIFGAKGYQATLMPAGMRGAYHLTNLAGAGMSFSVHPKIQAMLANEPQATHLGERIDERAVARLMRLTEFARAYEPDGLRSEAFVRYGAVQRTLAQFIESYNLIDAM